MPLIDLKTNLKDLKFTPNRVNSRGIISPSDTSSPLDNRKTTYKTLKYQGDMPGYGASGQPFIQLPISGNSNSMIIGQNGNSNIASVNLYGNNNSATVTQTGNNHGTVLNLVNAGGANTVSVIQTGTGDAYSLQQTCTNPAGCSVSVIRNK